MRAHYFPLLVCEWKCFHLFYSYTMLLLNSSRKVRGMPSNLRLDLSHPFIFLNRRGKEDAVEKIAGKHVRVTTRKAWPGGSTGIQCGIRCAGKYTWAESAESGEADWMWRRHTSSSAAAAIALSRGDNSQRFPREKTLHPTGVTLDHPSQMIIPDATEAPHGQSVDRSHGDWT